VYLTEYSSGKLFLPMLQWVSRVGYTGLSVQVVFVYHTLYSSVFI